MDVLFLCINLKRSFDRRSLMEEEARKALIDLRFVQAIDGRELALDSVTIYNRVGRLRYGPDLKSNEVACVLSHKAALRTFLASDANAAVILEDDAVLSDHFLDFVYAAVASRVPWDAINLENRNRKPLRPAIARFEFGYGLYVSAWLSAGATGWLYSRAGAERVLDTLQNFRHPYDTHLGFFWRHGLTALCAHPGVVSQRNIPSTISTPGESRTLSRKHQSALQYLRSRVERIRHEICKEIIARVILAKLIVNNTKPRVTGQLMWILRRHIAFALVRLTTRKDDEDVERKYFYDQLYGGGVFVADKNDCQIKKPEIAFERELPTAGKTAD
jgi:GR25 family glycosyltransferase involved in LPS biosynthesis